MGLGHIYLCEAHMYVCTHIFPLNSAIIVFFVMLKHNWAT